MNSFTTFPKIKILPYIVLTIILFFSIDLKANYDPPVLVLEEVPDTTLNISDYCGWYVDRTGKKEIENILDTNLVHFSPFHVDSTRSNDSTYFDYNYWLKLSIKSTSQKIDSLLLYLGYHGNISLYSFNSEVLIDKKIGGWKASSFIASYSENRIYLPIKIQEENLLNLFIQIKPYRNFRSNYFYPKLTPIQKEMEIRGKNFIQYYSIHLFFKIGLSILLFFAVLSFGHYFFIKDSSFLFYGFYLFCFYLYIQGRITYLMYPFDDSILYAFFNYKTATVLEELLLAFAYIAYGFFVKSFLDLPKKSKRVDNYFNFIIKFLCVFVAFILVDNLLLNLPGKFSTSVFNGFLLIFCFLSIYALILLWKIRGNLTIFVIIGSIFFFLGVSFGFILSIGFDPLFFLNSILLDYTFTYTLLGVLIEAIFFSIGLVYRTKIIQLEKQEALKDKELAIAKTKLYANITHEFRTPLTIIKGNANLILKNPKVKLEERVAGINQYSDNLKSLVNDMLDLAKLESKNVNLSLNQGDLLAYINYLVESFQSLAVSEKISLSFHSEEKDLMIDYSEKAIQQIISNLISNAIKFTPEFGKISVHLRKNKNKNAIIEIKDSGKGIPSEDVDQIFDPFYQSKNQEGFTGKGTGLGLAIVKELVQLMNGKIQVESQIEKGTTFKIILPITTNTALFPTQKNEYKGFTKAQTNPNQENPARLGLAHKVLIVEDNPDVKQYLEDLLTGSYSILKAKNGQEGLELAKKEEPAIIISDEMMPIMSGFEMLETLKQEESLKHIPVIILTARASRSDELEGLKLKADAYLKKPLDEEKLFILISNLIEKKNEKATTLRWEGKSVFNEFMKLTLNILNEKYADHTFKTFDLKYALQKKGHGADRKVERLIKEHFKTTTAKLIKDYRLEKAHQLLKTNLEFSIPEIIDRVGLDCDQTYFTKIFKEKFDKTPADVRK